MQLHDNDISLLLCTKTIFFSVFSFTQLSSAEISSYSHCCAVQPQLITIFLWDWKPCQSFCPHLPKVEKILKGSLDSIPAPSPSVKIQIMSRNVCLSCKGKTAGCCQQTFENKKFVDINQQCFALLTQVNFSAKNLNFHWRWSWWDRIQASFKKILL